MGKKTGPKPMEFTSEQHAQVLALATYGVRHDEIASFLGICKNTLLKNFKKELDEAKLEKERKVRKFLFEGATGEAMKTHDAT